MNTPFVISEETGRYRLAAEATPADIISLALSLCSQALQERPVLSDPAAVRQHLALHLAGLEHEEFHILLLDSQHRLLGAESAFRGTIDACSVYPREIVKSALRANAAAVIFAHNHPSGVAEPSHADRVLTERLKQALQLVDIRVLDHFVVGHGTTVSFAERGWL